MPTTLSHRSAPKTKPLQTRPIALPLRHQPDYIVLHPPGDVLKEKMLEMEIDVPELAARLNVDETVVLQLFKAAIPLTQELAMKIELATQMSAEALMQTEAGYLKNLALLKRQPETPVYDFRQSN
ncbi:hypothetical protein FACS1894170_12210 [Planctomycetales bacterium]|nr:hypothetical protein FACS1894170_12210 [Planctomycetales bacterium]